MAKIKSTSGAYPLAQPRTMWVGMSFFLIIHLVGILGTPLYIIYHGVSGAEWLLFLSYVLLTNMAITMGYHRLFAHKTFETNSLILFFLLFFGAATFEESALKWASQHRQHHRFTDTDQDPYNIKRGFWYAHMGWIVSWKHRVNYDSVNDLQKSKLILHQHAWYSVWSVVSGVILPMMIGIAIGRPLGAFLMAVCLRLGLLLNSAFFVNLFCHTFGKRTFGGSLSAKDHWMGAFLTNGEGYHDFHHRFPSDYRNGIRWYDWDPTKWLIFALSKLRLARDLKKTQSEKIRLAQISGRAAVVADGSPTHRAVVADDLAAVEA